MSVVLQKQCSSIVTNLRKAVMSLKIQLQDFEQKLD